MKTKSIIAAAAFAAGLAVPAAAYAANAYTTGDVNMRAGPSTGFPRITTLPEGVGVTVHGCTRGWSWCDTSWRGARGWVSARYLESLYQGRRVYVPDYGPRIGVPVITFSFGTYWDRYYHDRPWYRDRDRWRRDWRRDDLAGDDRRRRDWRDDDDEDHERWRRDRRGDDVADRFETRMRSSAGIELDRRPGARSKADDTPPGIRKKGRDFCPPGQAKKGRC